MIRVTVFAVERASEGKLRTVSPSALLGTVAGRFAATAKALNERTRAHFTDGGQLFTDFIAPLLKRGK